MKNLFVKIALFVTLFIGLYSFNENTHYAPGIFVQRVTSASGTTINLIPANSDVLVMVDLAATIPALTIALPNNPSDQQLLGMTTRSNITNMNLLITGGGSIVAPVTTLPAGDVAWYIYNQAGNRWFKYN